MISWRFTYKPMRIQTFPDKFLFNLISCHPSIIVQLSEDDNVFSLSQIFQIIISLNICQSQILSFKRLTMLNLMCLYWFQTVNVVCWLVGCTPESTTCEHWCCKKLYQKYDTSSRKAMTNHREFPQSQTLPTLLLGTNVDEFL